MRSRNVTAVILCMILVACAGCAGLSGSDNQSTMAEPEQLAPGITTSGVSDAMELANSHLTTLRSGQFVKRTTFEVVNGSTTTSIRESRLSYANQSYWRWNRTSQGVPIGFNITNGTVIGYTEGERVIYRLYGGKNTTYHVPQLNSFPDDPPVPPKRVLPEKVFERNLVYQLIANANITVERAGADLIHIHGTTDEVTFANSRVTGVEFQMHVSSEGVIQQLNITYRAGGSTVHRTILFEMVDSNPVKQPTWYHRASNTTA